MTAGSLTTIFLTLWYYDPSFVTLISLIGLTVTLADYIVPRVIPLIAKPENWTGKKEKQLEQVGNLSYSLLWSPYSLL